MHFLWFLLIGLAAGALAKAIMPGSRSEPSGWILTMVLGVAGAMLAGAVGFGGLGLIGSLVSATVGAIVIIGLFRLFTGGKKAV